MALALRPARNSFGSCWSCVDDLTMPSVMVTGNRVVAEAIVRRWNTPRGGLVDDPNYGYDLTDFLSDDLDRTDLGRIGELAASEATKDERVLSCVTRVTLEVDGSLTVRGTVTTATGPFQLVANVSQVTVALLQVTNQ